MNKILRFNSQTKITWNSFHETINKQLSQKIIDYAKSNGLVYVGGKCTYKADIAEDEFSRTTTLLVNVNLYFKEQFAEKKNIEEQHMTLKKNYAEFDYINDAETEQMLKEIVRNPVEENVIKPLIDKL